MKPYYEDDMVQLYHGDCREVTVWLAADALVTDPPYGMAYESNFNRDRRNLKKGRPVAGDSTTDVRDTALAMWGDRAALVFGRWNIARPVATHTRLVWDRVVHGMGNLANPWGPSDEEVYVLGTGFQGPRTGTVLRVPRLESGAKNRPDHPTPKPVALMEVLIAKCPQGVIADPFAGSGATLVAAMLQGRKAIGVEVEERYCEMIARRLAQGSLFGGDVA